MAGTSPKNTFDRIPKAFRDDAARLVFEQGNDISVEAVVAAVVIRDQVMAQLKGLEDESLFHQSLMVSKAVQAALDEDDCQSTRELVTAMIYADLVQSRQLVSSAVEANLSGTGKDAKKRKKRKELEVKERSMSAKEEGGFKLALQRLKLPETATYQEIITAIKGKGVREIAMFLTLGLYDKETKPSLEELGQFTSGEVIQGYKKSLQWKFNGERLASEKMAPRSIQAHFARICGAYLKGNYASRAQSDLDKAWSVYGS